MDSVSPPETSVPIFISDIIFEIKFSERHISISKICLSLPHFDPLHVRYLQNYRFDLIIKIQIYNKLNKFL